MKHSSCLFTHPAVTEWHKHAVWMNIHCLLNQTCCFTLKFPSRFSFSDYFSVPHLTSKWRNDNDLTDSLRFSTCNTVAKHSPGIQVSHPELVLRGKTCRCVNMVSGALTQRNKDIPEFAHADTYHSFSLAHYCLFMGFVINKKIIEYHQTWRVMFFKDLKMWNQLSRHFWGHICSF